MTTVYVDGESKLNKGQTKKVVAFLRELARTAEPVNSNFGICWNLHYFLRGIKGYCSGYDMVTNLAVGFPNVAMNKARPERAFCYPIDDGYGEGISLWEVGNRRTELCTHIANRLQNLLDNS